MNDESNYSLLGAESIDDVDLLKDIDCKKLTVTGLRQESFDYLIQEYGSRFDEIDFFKCPLVPDLSMIEQLINIKTLSYYWNQRANALWDLSKNPQLKSLSIDDFTRINSLEELTASTSLEELNFGNKVWSTFVLDSLEPLTRIENLKKLSFTAKKVVDGSIAPLANIKNLEELNFPTNLFKTEQVAWLTAKIGSTVISNVLAPSLKHSEYTFIIGKRKPSLNTEKDKARIEKYKDKFFKLVEHYKSNPESPEPL